MDAFDQAFNEEGRYTLDELIQVIRIAGNVWEDSLNREYSQFIETEDNPSIDGETFGICSGFVFRTDAGMDIKMIDAVRGITPGLAYKTKDNKTIIFIN